ncbi:D-aminoacyl-tRNA deacylase [Candidatus Woesearchaeota archaeon]|nr:D-aminoacyl-tRNA deacylase [Candidatus Woesearchaeota archaeon]
MNIALIISTCDYAGLNIQQALFKHAPFNQRKEHFEDKPIHEWQTSLHTVRTYMTDDWCVEAENIDSRIKWPACELIIFPITHRSAEGVPSLTVHTPGNWDKAELGGKPRWLPMTHAPLMKFALQTLKKEASETSHNVTMEATHHGPYVEKPIFFIEIGSSEEQWKDPVMGEIIAKTLIYVLSQPIPECKIAIGIGGPHYMPNFNNIALNTDIAVGHVCPKYNLSHLDREMIQKAMCASNASFVLLDWKGMGQEKERIVALLDELKIKWEKTQKY